MASELKLNPIDTNLLDRLLALPAFQAQEESLRGVDLPDRDRLPVLVLPPELLPFSEELAFWVHLRAFQDLLVLMVSYFELRHGPGGWAIPYASKPRDEFEALQQQLEFDEGWENSFPACLVVIKPSEGWRAALGSVVKTGVLGISVTDAKSVYPMRLQPGQIEDLAHFLGSSA